MEFLIANWPAITAGAIAFLATIDKIGLLFFKTLRNLADYWKESFPGKE